MHCLVLLSTNVYEHWVLEADLNIRLPLHTSIPPIKRFIQPGTTRDRSRPGRQTATTATAAVSHFIQATRLRSHFRATSGTIAKVHALNGLLLSETMRHCLKAEGINWISSYIGPLLTHQHRQRQIQ